MLWPSMASHSEDDKNIPWASCTTEVKLAHSLMLRKVDAYAAHPSNYDG
jgi:hypothetical protein